MVEVVSVACPDANGAAMIIERSGSAIKHSLDFMMELLKKRV
jgi:hypothetical protein